MIVNFKNFIFCLLYLTFIIVFYRKNRMRNCFTLATLILLALSVSCLRRQTEAGLYNAAELVNICNDSADILNPLSEGNGTLYFTFDITGLQTFPEQYSHGKPLKTRLKTKEGCINTGLLGLALSGTNNQDIMLEDIKEITQKLELANGIADSRFRVFDKPVRVLTLCHPGYNMISVKIISELVLTQKLKIKLSLSTGNKSATPGNTSVLTSDSNNVAIITVNTEKTPYRILIWKNNAEVIKPSPGLFYLDPPVGDSVYSFSCQFLFGDSTGRIQTFGETETATRKMWRQVWTNMTYKRTEGTKAGKDDERSYIISRYLKRIKSCDVSG